MSTLERLKELEAKATPGPWKQKGYRNLSVVDYKVLAISTNHPNGDWENIFVNAVCIPDFELIVEMRNALPKLLALVDVVEEYFLDDTGEFNPKYFPKRAAVQKALKALHEETK